MKSAIVVPIVIISVALLLPKILSLYGKKKKIIKMDKYFPILFSFLFVGFFIPLNIGNEKYNLFRFILEGNIIFGLIAFLYIIAFIFLFLKNIKKHYYISFFSFFSGYILSWVGMIKYIPNSAISRNGIFSLFFLLCNMMLPLILNFFYFPHFKSLSSKAINNEIKSTERLSKEKYTDSPLEKSFILKRPFSEAINYYVVCSISGIMGIIFLFIPFAQLSGIVTFDPPMTISRFFLWVPLPLLFISFAIWVFSFIIFSPSKIIIDSKTIKIKRIWPPTVVTINCKDIKNVYYKLGGTRSGHKPGRITIELNSGKKYSYYLRTWDSPSLEKLLNYFRNNNIKINHLADFKN